MHNGWTNWDTWETFNIISSDEDLYIKSTRFFKIRQFEEATAFAQDMVNQYYAALSTPMEYRVNFREVNWGEIKENVTLE